MYFLHVWSVYAWCVCVCVFYESRLHACHGIHVKVRRQCGCVSWSSTVIDSGSLLSFTAPYSRLIDQTASSGDPVSTSHVPVWTGDTLKKKSDWCSVVNCFYQSGIKVPVHDLIKVRLWGDFYWGDLEDIV